MYFTLTWVSCAAQVMIAGVLRFARLRHHGVAAVSVLYLPLSTAVVWLLEVSPTFRGPLVMGIYPYCYSCFSKIQMNFPVPLLICDSVLLFQTGVASLLPQSVWEDSMKRQRIHTSLVQVHRSVSSPVCAPTTTFFGFFSVSKQVGYQFAVLDHCLNLDHST